MGFFDSFSDLLEAALPWSSAEAEAPKDDDEVKVGNSLCLYVMLSSGLAEVGYNGMGGRNWDVGELREGEESRG